MSDGAIPLVAACWDLGLVVWRWRWLYAGLVVGTLAFAVAGVAIRAQTQIAEARVGFVVPDAQTAPGMVALVSGRATSESMARRANLSPSDIVTVREGPYRTSEIVLRTRDPHQAVVRVNALAAALVEEINGGELLEWEAAQAKALAIGAPRLPPPPPRIRLTDLSVSATRSPVSILTPVIAALVGGSVGGVFVVATLEAFARERARRRAG